MLLEEYFNTRDQHPVQLHCKILERLNTIFIHQIDELHSKTEKINYWQHPLEALSFKLSSHVASMQKLLSKTPFTYKGIILEMIDISSINILTRAIIENYLTLYHFHYDNIDSSQKEFRFLIYAISALKNRQLFTTTSEDNAAQKARDLIEIEKFYNHMKKNEYFLNLPEKNKNHYLNTKDAKQLNWIDLLSNSDLNPLMFKDTWRLLSNYAHSEFLSVLQLRQFPESLTSLNMRASLMATLSSIILSSSILHMNALFSSSKNVYSLLDTEATSLVQYFSEIGLRNNSEGE